jgi:hypothetical protein
MALRWFILEEENQADKLKEIDQMVSLLCDAMVSQQG